MTRTYTLRKRAERQAETRARIVEAAIALHGTLGPARTTLSLVAERAGVQRHTLYAHFPDEWSLALACSGTHLERHPLPDPEPWSAIADPRERLRAGLGALHAWYGRNDGLAGCVLRDAEVHEVSRAIIALRLAPVMQRMIEVLGSPLAAPQRPMLALALSFFTWRTLVREGGLAPEAAVEQLVRAIVGAADGT